MFICFQIKRERNLDVLRVLSFGVNEERALRAVSNAINATPILSHSSSVAEERAEVRDALLMIRPVSAPPPCFDMHHGFDLTVLCERLHSLHRHSRLSYATFGSRSQVGLAL